MSCKGLFYYSTPTLLFAFFGCENLLTALSPVSFIICCYVWFFFSFSLSLCVSAAKCLGDCLNGEGGITAFRWPALEASPEGSLHGHSSATVYTSVSMSKLWLWLKSVPDMSSFLWCFEVPSAVSALWFCTHQLFLTACDQTHNVSNKMSWLIFTDTCKSLLEK